MDQIKNGKFYIVLNIYQRDSKRGKGAEIYSGFLCEFGYNRIIDRFQNCT